MRSTLCRAAVALAIGALSLTPAASHAAARPPVPGAERIDGGWAVPAPTTGPSWYDAAYAKRVLAAGTKGVRLPQGATLPNNAKPVGLATSGIRPGIWLVTIQTGPVFGFAWCTANFVFKSGSTFGLGTAGHCAAADALGGFPDVTAYVVPPVGSGSLPGFYHIGTFSLSHNNGIGDDFAMINIKPQYNSWVNPNMPVFGGPTSVYATNTPTVVTHFGHGLGVGLGGTPRVGLCTIMAARGGNAFAWYGVGFEGDSGSAVDSFGGQGVGNFTHIVILDGVPGEILPGMLAGTRLTKILSIAAGWTLVTGTWPVPTP
ncbi:MAG: hypothetical protein QOE45_711 [Frankiaceae bacterium]|jgi:hypothetical protein|nr:hypothetical protein [Frankiaceae bacterium]